MTEHAYIHIPFCLRKCKYCSFISGFNIEKKEQYLTVLLDEIKTKYKKEKLKTLYFGGGTPSLLDAKDIEQIISAFNFGDSPEITLESNPETVEKVKFANYQKIGINRISLGVQTFNNDILKLIGRNHCDKTIYDAIKIIKTSGFNNISVDLIYGLPNQTKELFIEDLNKAVKLDIQHISAYGLKIEEGSFFYKNPPNNLPDDEMQAELFLYMIEELEKNGFIHYEISNFAKKNYESKHNNSYWKNKHYYGFGINASGYENNIRYKNTSDFEKYIKNPHQKEESNILSPEQIMEDEIFLALRLKDGINIKDFNCKYNMDFLEKYKHILIKYKDFIQIKNDIFSLNRHGILVCNEIMSEFIN